MKKMVSGLTLVGLCSLTVACALEVADENSIDSKEQALGVATKVKRVEQEWENENPTEVSCGSEGAGTPYALSVNGGGTGWNYAVQKMNFVMNDGETRGAQVKMQYGVATSVAICGDYIPYRTARVYDSDGNHITHCPSGYVAVGGEGICAGSSAKLIENRPYPANAGDEPTAWKAVCSSGGVHVSANCVEKGGARDWDDCKVRKQVNTNAPSALTWCQAGELAVGSGAYCGDGGHIKDHAVRPSMDNAAALCSEDRTSVYAICCPGVYEP